MDDEQGRPNQSTTTKTRSGTREGLIDTFAVQCGWCFKWRKIYTREVFEEIRMRVKEEEFVCNTIEGVSCLDDAELEYDSTRIWVVDKPGVAKTPTGFEREIVLRKDNSRVDVFYVTPTGKKMRTLNELAAFIDANPDFKDTPLEEFTFTAPKIMEETIPGGKRKRISKPSKEHE
ncbi:PREDICTED: methyl-CpG-binding domain-containing protein 1-like [Camelina sativa]|uniref:Methyl-CpG-binding domain-containing protein 1-like n=1 Tax=Camelina sativa TaxID=90675 RepID=A0ABM0U3U8_CAMSA|nr:PREDICTED: methyl-CpG-binding domain-containing protein 1-like [Camelina sativa]